MIDEKNGEILKIRVSVKGIRNKNYLNAYGNYAKQIMKTKDGNDIEVEMDSFINPAAVREFVASLDNKDLSELRRQMSVPPVRKPRYPRPKGDRPFSEGIRPVYNFVTTEENGEKKKITEGKEQK